MARYSGNILTQLTITTDNSLELLDTVWDDLRFPATTLKAGQTNPPTFSDSYVGWVFDNNSTEVVFFIAQLPHSIKLGSDLHPHLHWAATTSDVSVNVLWRMEYAWIAAENQVHPGTFNTINRTVELTGTAYEVILTEFGPISKPSSGTTGISDLLFIKLSRVGGSDTYNDLAILFEADIHYEINTLGSRQEYIK